MLDYITPDAVHVFLDGRIVESGDASLADTIEEDGYDAYRAEAVAG
jgi:Fe-S cluster assembly ATP-binding protein